MIQNLRNLMYLFPVMIYYLIESMIIAIFTTFLGRVLLYDLLGGLSYFQWVGIIWIIKVIFFDVFKLITGLSGAGEQMQRMEDENQQ